MVLHNTCKQLQWNKLYRFGCYGQSLKCLQCNPSIKIQNTLQLET